MEQPRKLSMIPPEGQVPSSIGRLVICPRVRRFGFRAPSVSVQPRENDGTIEIMTFRLTADFIFQAEDLDDAFDKVANEFRSLKDSERENANFPVRVNGYINLKPADSES